MPAKKDTATKRKVSKGDVYECGVCGMPVIIDEPCGCEETVITCCDQPMKEKTKAKEAR
jgi:hypothetical protein